MAPKDRSRQPSEEKPVNKEPSSEEEESEDEESEDEGSESPSSSAEKDKNDFSGETGQDEDEDLISSKSKIDSKPVNESDSDSDLGTPSSYKLQPISRVSKSSSKRTRDDDESQSPVRSSKKPKSVGSSFSTPGGCINRLWSDEDELTVLNGMIEFKNNTDIGAFYNFIKGKLQEKFSKDQLNSKIKRLKKRFSNAMNKSENGEDPVFFKPHEGKAFKLSKKIWGGFVSVRGKNEKKDQKEGLNVEKVELDDKEKSTKENDNEEVGFIGSKYPYLVRSFESIMSTMPSLEMSKSGMCFALKRLSSKKAEELNEKWKVLITEEVELNHKKLTLMQEQMNTAFDFVE